MKYILVLCLFLVGCSNYSDRGDRPTYSRDMPTPRIITKDKPIVLSEEKLDQLNNDIRKFQECTDKAKYDIGNKVRWQGGKLVGIIRGIWPNLPLYSKVVYEVEVFTNAGLMRVKLPEEELTLLTKEAGNAEN